MAATLSQNALRWTLTPIILAALTATAAAGSFTRGCAARDMQVLMLIEERENTRTVSADQVREAMYQLLHARIVCTPPARSGVTFLEGTAKSDHPDHSRAKVVTGLTDRWVMQFSSLKVCLPDSRVRRGATP